MFAKSTGKVRGTIASVVAVLLLLGLASILLQAKPSNPLPLTDYQVMRFAFSGDEKTVVTAGYTNSANEFRLYDAQATGEWHLRKVIPMPGQMIASGATAVAFGPQNHLYAAEPESNGTVQLWDINTGRPIGSFFGGKLVSGISLTPDGTTFATVGSNLLDNNWYVKIWDVRTHTLVRTLRTPAEKDKVALCLSPDGQEVAVGQYGDITVWDVATGIPLRTLHRHSAAEVANRGEKGTDPNAMAFSPDGKLLAVADLTPKMNGVWLFGSHNEGELTVWDINKGKRRVTLPDHKQGSIFVSFSGNKQLWCALSSKGYRVFENNIQAWKTP